MNSKIIPIDFGKRDVMDLLSWVTEQNPSDVTVCFTDSKGEQMSIVSSVGELDRILGQIKLMENQVLTKSLEDF